MSVNSYKIFKQGSTTFFTASLFFPKKIRNDVFALYAFVRVFDDFVDCVPQRGTEYFALKDEYLRQLSNGFAGDYLYKDVVSDFILVQRKYDLEQSWIDAFFASMEMDLHSRKYETISDTEEYMYGSAEVIGLMMAKIMKLPQDSYSYARLLGRAFQFMNMIRDMGEDRILGRTYLPAEDLNRFGLTELSADIAQTSSDQFNQLIRFEISRYQKWRDGAKTGLGYIPRRYLIPIKASMEMFDYTINIIEKDPQVLWFRKIKPTKLRALYTTFKQIIQ